MTVRVRNEPQHFAVPLAGDIGNGAPCVPCELIVVYGAGYFRPVLTALAQAVAEGRACGWDRLKGRAGCPAG
jgi:hypothetical protein